MPLGINGPDNNIPAIQKSHQTTDGGAGNLGYFNQGKKKKEEEEEDIFTLSEKEDEEQENPLVVELDSIGNKVKGIWNSIRNNLKQKNNEESKPEDI